MKKNTHNLYCNGYTAGCSMNPSIFRLESKYTHTVTHMHTLSHTHTHTHTLSLIHAHTHNIIHTSIHTQTCTCTCSHMHTHTRTHTHTHTCTHTYTHNPTHTHTYTHTHAHAHTLTHSHMHTHSPKSDTCKVCDAMKVKLDAESYPVKISQLTGEWDLHKIRAQGTYQHLKEDAAYIR